MEQRTNQPRRFGVEFMILAHLIAVSSAKGLSYAPRVSALLTVSHVGRLQDLPNLVCSEGYLVARDGRLW